jgi:two-component SAPR family response regulator
MRILNYQEEKHPNAILLFGGFQVFDRKGFDVTRSFTPILTKLFLAILMNSLREGKGLTSGMLIDLIWSGREERSAKNTLAVNIIRLRRILDELDGCQITNETRYWKFEFDPQVLFIDYYDYLFITRSSGIIERSRVTRLIRLFQAGPPLKDISFEGADTFKAEVSNKATDFLWHFVKTLDVGADADMIIEVCNTIFIFDELDEDAMILKCQTLLKAGKHSLAVQCFDNFNRQYLELYGEEFGRSYKEIFGIDPT